MAKRQKQATAEAADPYLVLGLNPRAEQVVFEAAHQALKRSLAARGDNQGLSQLETAWALIGDPDTRAEFDAEHRRHLDGKVVGGRYRIDKFIAEGATGETYQATYLIDGDGTCAKGDTVCLKHFSKIDPKLDSLLIQEFLTMRRVRHYAFPAAHELIRLDDGCLALVMSFIKGPTLEQAVEKVGALKPEAVCGIADRLLNSLMYLHHEGIVHGDLKPQNIILQPKTHLVALVDFGLAVVKPTSGSSSKGYTDDFAAPELVAENRPPLPESDLYGLGMVMTYALGGGMRAVKRKALPKGIPDPLRRFVKRLIVLDPLARPRWENENLCRQMEELRQECFGRIHTDMEGWLPEDE